MKSCSDELFDLANFAKSSPDGCMLISAKRLSTLALDVQMLERQLDKVSSSPLHRSDYSGWGKGKDE